MSIEDVDSPKTSCPSASLDTNTSLPVAEKAPVLKRQPSPHTEPSTPSSAQLDFIDSWFNLGFDLLDDRNRMANAIVVNNKKIASSGYPLCKKFVRIKQLVKQRHAGWRLLGNQVALLPELLNMVQNCEKRMESMITSLDKIEKMCKRRRLSQHDKALLQVDAGIQKKINQYEGKRERELEVARSRLKKQQESLDFKKRREKAIRDSKGAAASKLEFGRMFFKTTSVPRTAKALEAEASNPNDNKNPVKVSFTFISEEKSSEVIIKPRMATPVHETSPHREENIDQTQSEDAISEQKSNLGMTSAALPSSSGAPTEISVKPEINIENAEAKEDNESSDGGNNQNILDDFWSGSESVISWSSQKEMKKASYSDAEIIKKNDQNNVESIHSTDDREASASLCAFREFLASGEWEKYLNLFTRAAWGLPKLERCQSVGDLIRIGVLPQDAKLMIGWLQETQGQNEISNRNQIPAGLSSPKEQTTWSDEVLAASSTLECKEPINETKEPINEAKEPIKETLEPLVSEADIVDHPSGEDVAAPPPLSGSKLTNEQEIETTGISEILVKSDDEKEPLSGSKLTNEQEIETTGISEILEKSDDEKEGPSVPGAESSVRLRNDSDVSSRQSSASLEIIKIDNLHENQVYKIVD